MIEVRLIDEAALINEAETGNWDVDIKELKMILKYVPEINAVPVVRCSECISHGTLTNGNLFCGKRFTGVYGEYHVVKPDDYCSYGKRREK